MLCKAERHWPNEATDQAVHGYLQDCDRANFCEKSYQFWRQPQIMLTAGVQEFTPASQRRSNIQNRVQIMTVPANHSDEHVSANVRIVEIPREPVELYKILKFEGLVANGGQAKVVVATGQVRVNGKVETQKRKKIVVGDTIEFNNKKMCIKLALTVATEVSSPKTIAEPVAHKQVNEGTGGNSPAIGVKKQ